MKLSRQSSRIFGSLRPREPLVPSRNAKECQIYLEREDLSLNDQQEVHLPSI